MDFILDLLLQSGPLKASKSRQFDVDPFSIEWSRSPALSFEPGRSGLRLVLPPNALGTLEPYRLQATVIGRLEAVDEGSVEAVLRLAQELGPLGLALTPPSAGHPFVAVRRGATTVTGRPEQLSSWRSFVREIQEAVELRDAILQKTDRPIIRRFRVEEHDVIYATADGDRILTRSVSVPEPGGRDFAADLSVAMEAIERGLRVETPALSFTELYANGRFRRAALLRFARRRLASLTRHKVRLELELELGGKPSLSMRPSTLAEGVWAQLIASVSGQTVWRRCAFCPRMFPVERSDQKYCKGRPCRANAWAHRRRNAS